MLPLFAMFYAISDDAAGHAIAIRLLYLPPELSFDRAFFSLIY